MINTPQLHNDNEPLLVLQQQLAKQIDALTLGQQDVATPLTGFALFRREAISEPCSCVVEPNVVLVVQGVKQLLVGEQAFCYDRERFMITSLDVPGSSQVLQASAEQPCLGLSLRLDLGLIAELISQNKLMPPRVATNETSVHLGQLTASLLEPFQRLIALLADDTDMAVLAPLIQREIHYRLLQSDLAPRLWQIASVGSQSRRIARAIDWLQVHYAEPLSVESLAEHVQMSTSSLHHYFRQYTARSPLQYQKWLRLTEAKRLMLNEGYEAAQAAFSVGYESASQFSREYRRQFGAPPKRDIESLRHPAQAS